MAIGAARGLSFLHDLEVPVILLDGVLERHRMSSIFASSCLERSRQGNECDDEQPLMSHVVIIARRARNLTIRRREMIPASQILPFVPTSNMILVNGSSPENHNLDSCSWDAADSRRWSIGEK